MKPTEISKDINESKKDESEQISQDHLSFESVKGSDFKDYEVVVNNFRQRVWSYEGATILAPDATNAMLDKVDYDPSTSHFLYFYNGKLIASARVAVSNTIEEATSKELGLTESMLEGLQAPYAHMTRLVVDPKYRKLGLAHRLSLARIDGASKVGTKSIVVNAVGKTRGHYWESIGFRPVAKLSDYKSKVFLVARPATICVTSTDEICQRHDRRKVKRAG